MEKNKENYKYSVITEKIIGEAFFVHKILGYGFLEKVYENALFLRLKKLNFDVRQQIPINVYFENNLVGEYTADLLVENKVIVELKAVQKLDQIHEVQLVNYLKATELEVGLLINFGPKLDFKRRVFSKKQ